MAQEPTEDKSNNGNKLLHELMQTKIHDTM